MFAAKNFFLVGRYTGPIAVDYLVVAGGGGGGSNNSGGGGGAGGFRTASSFSVAGGTTYTITVGAGGAGAGSGASAAGSNGADSVFSSITSPGGGGGGSHDNWRGGHTYQSIVREFCSILYVCK